MSLERGKKCVLRVMNYHFLLPKTINKVTKKVSVDMGGISTCLGPTKLNVNDVRLTKDIGESTNEDESTEEDESKSGGAVESNGKRGISQNVGLWLALGYFLRVSEFFH